MFSKRSDCLFWYCFESTEFMKLPSRNKMVNLQFLLFCKQFSQLPSSYRMFKRFLCLNDGIVKHCANEE